MKHVQFSLKSLLLAVALTAIGVSMMLALETRSYVIWIAGSTLIGVTFGAAAGLLLNRLKACTAIGAFGWFLFSIFALLV